MKKIRPYKGKYWYIGQAVRGKRTKKEVIHARFLGGTRLKIVFVNGHLDLDKCCEEVE